jgi:trans-aconitate methyltransferase
MDTTERRGHWEKVYATKPENEVSWFEESPATSLELIHSTGVSKDAAVIDVGGGASRLVDFLLREDYSDVTVLDIAEQALAITRRRLGDHASRVRWIAADITQWEPASSWDVWHDRAVLHFLTSPEDRRAYVLRLLQALRLRGHLIIGTFAPDGPEQCSGLPVQRYDAAALEETLGQAFKLVEVRRCEHHTPMQRVQQFQFCRFLRTS